ncbi:cell wall integrity and stress response component 2-like [Penaeus japonicus]|uniref:cell wall integrity and stress response component 2-like n=1 Tax=Penaeus japonicus TaxID=27405 RepID=UPI001C7154B5|nr:cell wall integrity and stress response component 2-like [Penaeus japonicus]
MIPLLLVTAALLLASAPSPPSAAAAPPSFPRESRQLYTRSIARSVIDQAPSGSRLIGAKGDLPPLISRLVDNATVIREGIVDTFSCDGRYYGYYADQDNECQIFHICVPMKQLFPDLYDETDILQFSFICPKHTIFTQDAMVCAWQDSAFPCSEAHRLYDRNSMFFIVPAEEVRRERSDVEEASPSDSATTATATTVTSSTTTSSTTPVPMWRRTSTTEPSTTTTTTSTTPRPIRRRTSTTEAATTTTTTSRTPRPIRRRTSTTEASTTTTTTTISTKSFPLWRRWTSTTEATTTTSTTPASTRRRRTTTIATSTPEHEPTWTTTTDDTEPTTLQYWWHRRSYQRPYFLA